LPLRQGKKKKGVLPIAGSPGTKVLRRSRQTVRAVEGKREKKKRGGEGKHLRVGACRDRKRKSDEAIREGNRIQL